MLHDMIKKIIYDIGNSLAVQWLGLYAFTVGLGNKILQAMWHSQKRKEMRPNHFVVQLKLTQYCKLAIVRFKKKEMK